MTQSKSSQEPQRLRGVTELPENVGEVRYRARIRRGKGREVNLGVYPDRWRAAFAYNMAAEALHGGRRPPNPIPESRQPTADQVRWITQRVRRRLGLEAPPALSEDRPPSTDQLLTLLEITVVPFWRGQVSTHSAALGRELDQAARRLLDAAHALFWSHSSGHPTPLEALEQALAHRLDREFRRGDLTRAVLDDDGDDERQLARWLVYPDELPGGGGFRSAIASLHADLLGPGAFKILFRSTRLGRRPGNPPSLQPGAGAVGLSFSVESVPPRCRGKSRGVRPPASSL